MRKIMIIVPAIALVLTIVGCESDDERLARFAEESVDQQAQQNKAVAAQHQDIAKATRVLVVADAQSRADFAKLTGELHAQRKELDAQRDALENERRVIATQRLRDPVIAAAIKDLGLLCLCSLPLVVAFYVLRTISNSTKDETALNELLVEEALLAEPSGLLGPPKRPDLLDANKN